MKTFQGNTVISFSGGRTSGYMLWRILQAYGGKLPENVVIVFCNTGKEREETLEFVAECERRWGVRVRWLEYVAEPSGKVRPRDGKPLWKHIHREVSFAMASRNGEPYKMAIDTRNMLPNPVMRFCTGELKIKTMNRFVRRELGWEEYDNAIGLRFDEPSRVRGLLKIPQSQFTPRGLFDEIEDDEPLKTNPPGEEPCCPLYEDKIVLEDVMDFWREQRGSIELEAWLKLPKGERPGFDLALRPDEGNCDLCFLKGAGKLLRLIQARPQSADWWAEAEAKAKHAHIRHDNVKLFRADRPSYTELKEIATGKVPLPLWDDMDTVPCRCTD